MAEEIKQDKVGIVSQSGLVENVVVNQSEVDDQCGVGVVSQSGLDQIVVVSQSECDDEGGVSRSKHAPKYALFPSVRLLMICFSTIGISMIGSLYSSLNFSWVCMVNASHYANNSHLIHDDYGGTLKWDKGIQQNLFAAYSYGSLGVLFISAWLIERFGARLTLGCMTSLSCIATLCIPVAAYENYLIVMFLRITVGTIGSLFLPISYKICAHWSVKSELGITLSLTFLGFPTGQFANLLLAGIECETIGWQWIFYLSGGFGLLFSASWLLLFDDDPTECKYISQAELDYILENRDWKKAKGSTAKGLSTPWLKLFTSSAVWACMVARVAFVFVAWSVNQFTPTYLKEVIDVNVKGNGFLSSLPLLTQMGGRMFSGPLSDVSCLGSRTLRIKAFTFVSLFVSSIFYVSLRFVSKDTGSAVPVFLLCAVMFCASFNTGGFQKSPLYIAPQYSAAIGSLINIVGSSASIAMPYLVAGLTPHGTLHEWQIVFYVVASIGSAGFLFFALFGSGELQSWAKPKNDDIEVENLQS